MGIKPLRGATIVTTHALQTRPALAALRDRMSPWLDVLAALALALLVVSLTPLHRGSPVSRPAAAAPGCEVVVPFPMISTMNPEQLARLGAPAPEKEERVSARSVPPPARIYIRDPVLKRLLVEEDASTARTRALRATARALGMDR